MRHHAAIVPLLGELEPRILLSAAPALFEPAEAGNPGLLAVAAGSLLVNAAKTPLKPLSGTSGGTTTVRDDYGNTFATAAGVTLDAYGAATVNGQINYLGDVDFLAFTPAKNGSIRVGLTAVVVKRTSISGDLSAYAGTTLLVRDANAADTSAAVSFSVTAGTRYYIRVASLNSTLGKYGLRFAATWAVDPAPPPPSDPTPPPPPPPPAPPAPGPYTPGTQVTWQVETASDGLHLVVLGTDGADAITVSKSGGNTVIYVSGAKVWTTSQVFSGVQVYGFGGDDLLVSISGAAEAVWGGAGFDSFWTDSLDAIGDVEAAESAAKSVHAVSQFYQPTTDPAQRVSLELAGQKIADPATSRYAYADFSKYKLFTDGPEYNDVRQGGVGDCYFLAVLSSLAQTDPGTIRQAIAPLGDGSYAVRFFSNGQASYIRVDADLPVYGDISVRAFANISPEGELWVALAEKAYAQFRTGANSYASLAGGWMTPVYTTITGASASDVYTSGATEADLASRISQALQAGNAVSAASISAGSTAIVGNHAYEVRSVQYVNGQWTVTVYNVWGQDGKQVDSNYSDGLVTLTMSQFKQVFTALCISAA